MHEHHVPFTTEVGAGHDVAEFPHIYVKKYYVYDGIGATKSILNKWNNTGASTSVTTGAFGGAGILQIRKFELRL